MIHREHCSHHKEMPSIGSSRYSKQSDRTIPQCICISEHHNVLLKCMHYQSKNRINISFGIFHDKFLNEKIWGGGSQGHYVVLVSLKFIMLPKLALKS